jgi:hypothetical protein
MIVGFVHGFWKRSTRISDAPCITDSGRRAAHAARVVAENSVSVVWLRSSGLVVANAGEVG